VKAARGGKPEHPRVIVALDFADAARALALVERLDPASCRLKVGNELFTVAGPEFVRALVGRGFRVFLDLKFHDIPNTVAAACRAAAALGVWMINVHAAGGRAMLTAAREALAAEREPPFLIAVSVLTSLGDADLDAVGVAGTTTEAALRLSRLAQSCGLDGVVCSGHEAHALRSAFGAGFCLVTPGIRLAEDDKNDQHRIMTPRAAIENGAHYLVMGRPITLAPDPRGALMAVNREIASLA
jgi:orotidine-5'-phosphate decarboxylase